MCCGKLVCAHRLCVNVCVLVCQIKAVGSLSHRRAANIHSELVYVCAYALLAWEGTGQYIKDCHQILIIIGPSTMENYYYYFILVVPAFE